MEEKHFGPIRVIPGINGGKYPSCHSLYIENGGVLIDPGSDRKRLAEIREDPGVSEVWLSHWHEDHIMHLDLFDDLPLCVEEKDAPPLSQIERFLDAYGMDRPDDRTYWQEIMYKHFHYKPRKPARFLKDGQIMELGGTTVEVIGTPGHTPGHLAFFFREPGVLFLGDYDLSKFGPYYGDVASSIEDTVASVKRLRKMPARIWITGHETGLFEEDPGEIWDHYIGIISRREEKLLDRLKTPRTMDEIVKTWIIYGKPREPKAFFEFAERALMKKHLERLMGQNRVAKEGQRYVRR